MPLVDPEARRAYHRAWSAANRERTREYYRARQASDPEGERARARAWIEANRDHVRENQRANYHMHVEQRRATARAYYAANRERMRAYLNAWKAANPQVGSDAAVRRKARILGAPIVERVDRDAIIKRDKQRCHICGKRVAKKDITLDHIVPLAVGGEHSARNLAVAHASCNFRKGQRAANDQLRLVG